MDNRKLTAAETAKVEKFENELWVEQCKRNDEDYLFSDLTGLYVDIIREIGRINGAESVVIYEYASLLEQDLQLYSSREMYIAGFEARDKPLHDAMNGYICGVAGRNRERRLDSAIQEYYEKISALLGDKNGLIAEFTEIYRKVHGVVKNNIDKFIRLGQTSGGDTAL